jgi:hypothetical protein
MSDQESGTEEQGSGTPSGEEAGKKSSEAGKQQETISQEDFDRVTRANNWAQSKVKELKSTVDNLQAEISDLKADGKGGKKKEDSTQLAAAQEEIAKLKKSESDLKSRLHDVTVKETVRKELTGKIRDDAFDAFWAAEGQKFGEVEREGKTVVGITEKPWVTWDEYSQELSQRHSYFMASTRKKGGGVPDKGEGAQSGKGDEGKPTLDELNAMSHSDRVKAMTKWPELRKELAADRGFN